MSTAAEDLIRHHRFTVEDYYRMAEDGILAEDARVELIEGEVIEMPPIGAPHASVVTDLQNLLITSVGDRAIVRVQNPVHLGPHNEPQPDIALVRPPAAQYRARHPGPLDILLLIEVAESSLRLDRDLKLGVYARSGVPEVWLVDLRGSGILCYRSPGPARYRESGPPTDLGRVPVPGLPGLLLDLSALL